MSKEIEMKDNASVRLMIDEMQETMEKQKALLVEQSGKIEKLIKLLDDGDIGAKQDVSGKQHERKDEFEAVYEIIASLEKYTTEEVLFYAAQILAELMDTRDVGIYTVANRDYARLFSSTSPEARILGNSIKYTDMEEVYDQLREGRVYLNQAMNPRLPLMASGVYAEEELRVILMFWGIPSERLTLSEANRLTVIEALLQNAILRANRHMTNYRRHRYLEGTNVLNEEAFTALTKVFLDAKAKGLTECTLVEVLLGYQDYEDVAPQVSCNIRQTDYMGLMKGEKLYILLANTDKKNAEAVRERLKKMGYESIVNETLE